MAFPQQLSDEQLSLLQQQIQALGAEQSGQLQIGQGQQEVFIDPQIRRAFEASLSGQASPLFEQLGIRIDPTAFDLPQFRQNLPREEPLRPRVPQREAEQEFFGQFQSAEEQLPGRDPNLLAATTSEDIRAASEPFQTDQFNASTLEATIRQNLNVGNIVNRDRLFAQVQDVLAIGVSEALSSDDPQVNLNGVFATLGQALRDIGGDANNPVGLATIVDRAAFRLVSRQGLEDLSFVPQTDVATNLAIEALFGDALELATQIPNISVAEVQKIARDFSTELKRQIELGAATRQTFQNITKWIDTNVANTTLKAALRSQARMFEVELTRIESAQQLQVPPELVPTGEGRGILLSRDISFNFANELNKNINIVAQLPADEIGTQLNRLVDVTNKVIRDLRIHAVRDGRSVLPTISKITPGGTRKSPIDITRELQALAQELPSPTSTFTFLPTKSEGQPVNTREIVQDLNNRFTKQGQRSKAARKSIIHPSMRSEFGKVSILTQRGEGGRNDLEIVIPPNASMEDVLKVVQALLQEDGTLHDVDGVPLIEIKKGVTTIAQVLGAIRKEQKEMLGVEIRLSYLPSDPVGGGYLGGALSSLLKKPLHTAMKTFIPPSGIPKMPHSLALLSKPFHNLHQPVGGSLKLPVDSAGRQPEPFPFHIAITPESEARLNAARNGEDRVLPPDAQLRGGNIFGDIFGAVASVVTAPIQIVGSLLGGELPPDIVRELEMDSRRSVAAR